MKKVASIATAALMTACLAVPMATGFTASAATLSMTAPELPDDASIAEAVSAYQIFTLSQVVAGTAGQYNVTGWGTGVNASDLVTALKSDTVLGSYFTDLAYNEADKAASAKLVGKVIGGFTGDEFKAQAEAFAKVVMNNLSSAATSGTYDDEAGEVTFGTIENGYYVVSCKAVKENNQEESMSLGMLTVVDGNMTNPLIGTGEAKVGLPTVQKKVEENQQENYADADDIAEHETTREWNDVADYSIGDDVTFRLYGTMPSNLANYSSYYYKFTDNLDAKFDKPTELTITVNNGDAGKVDLTATYANDAWSVSGANATGVAVAYATTGNGFTVTFDDIKTNQNANSGTLVTVTYDAVLNSSAVVGLHGQNNAVNLTYSNNPNVAGDGSTDTTPDDKVKVYTYGVRLDKEFFDAAGGSLTPEEVTAGVYNTAEFSLSKGTDKLYFLPCADEGFDYVLAKQGDKVGDTDATTVLKLTLVNNNDLVIRIKGLDEGAYTLKEDKVPAGYNKAADQTITITAETVNDQGWTGVDTDVTLEKFSWVIGTEEVEQTGNGITGVAVTEMQNRKGTTLPGTGGIGTTLFYLIGGTMFVSAGVYLVSKKRMKNREEQ